MKQPRITVITANHNQGDRLERAICSVLDQGFDNLEYFVIDGGSTDDSVDIIRRYKNDLVGWVSEPDTGTSHAINKGLRRATGDIVAYLQSDDVCPPGTLVEVADRMSGPGAPAWLVGQCQLLNESQQVVATQSTTRPESLLSYLMHDSGYLPGSASFWRRRLVEAHGLFDERLRFAFDYEYACRLMAAGQWPEVVRQPVVWRRANTNCPDAADTLGRGLEHLAAARRHADHLPLSQRYGLWVNCDTRRRIYTLAQAEMVGIEGRRFLWHQLLRHPWWITNDAVRRAVVHGIDHPLPAPAAIRSAA